MKVILKEDIKGKGKRNDVKDLANGYANFLIKAGKAVLFTDESYQEVLDEAALDAAKDAELRQLATEYKKYLSEYTLTFTRKVAPDGTLIRKVTKKEIIEKINLPSWAKAEKIEMNQGIKYPGISNFKIKLYKDIVGLITVEVYPELSKKNKK